MRKANRPLPAPDLYVSPLFRAARAYAERRYGPDGWLILSGRHGLVHPNQVLAPYDLSLRQLTRSERAAWGDRVAVELTDRFPPGTVLWFHAGALYRAAIAPVVPLPARARWPACASASSSPGIADKRPDPTAWRAPA